MLAFISTFTGQRPHRLAGQTLTTRTLQMTLSKSDIRRKLTRTQNFTRAGFASKREEATSMMEDTFTSDIMSELLRSANTVTRGDVTVHLSSAYGFCWGVHRAISMAFQTRRMYPASRVWITNEIIHNPIVNDSLKEFGILFVPRDDMLIRDLSVICKEDVVILPAFGATLQELQYLNELGCQIIDTTCPWVSKVWNAVDKHKKAEVTSIIHGIWKHEETMATTSYANKYIIVYNMEEAESVAHYILHGGDTRAFMDKFKNAVSEGFNPETDLEAIGIANQTTMMKSETTAIGKLFEHVMMLKYGPAQLNKHFVAFNTICDAVEERQTAMHKLLRENPELDIVLIVGGFTSHNTGHLQEIAEEAGVTSYWVERADCIGPGNKITYQSGDAKIREKENWIPSGPVTIGVSAGASTPDKVIGDVLDRVFMISKLRNVSVVQ